MMSENTRIPEHAARQFYRPICTEKEIDRIFNVKSAKDAFLKIRADIAVDNMRLFRFFLNVRRIQGSKYRFEKCLSDQHYRVSLSRFPKAIKRHCRDITFGDTFSNRANGKIFIPQFGPIVSISYSLRYFLKFFHLAFMHFEQEVPMGVRMNALRIAIRVMLQQESLDFLQDPRGIIPQSIALRIHDPIRWQLAFIASHEFGHYALGHLDKAQKAGSSSKFIMNDPESKSEECRIFNRSEQEEFDADSWAFLNFRVNATESADFNNAVILWYLSLEVVEVIEDQMFPKCGWQQSTHPTSRERLIALVDKFPSLREQWAFHEKSAVRVLEDMKESIQYDAATSMESYETYGSVYLAEPNTEWRGPQLMDRVDYY